MLLENYLYQFFHLQLFRFSMQNRLFWRWTENVDIKIPDNISQLANANGNNNMEVDEDKDDLSPVDAVDIALLSTS
jgi:hypothetical protein